MLSQDWEDKFRKWAKPPSQTEQERCDNAISVIRNAIKASNKLGNRNISCFVQGSYRNNTNVRNDSDVDIGILCNDTFFYDLPKGKVAADYAITPATYGYNQFKNEVEEALISYLGGSAVNRGNKAFDIHETSYHVDADVAAFFEYRFFHENGTILKGVKLRSDNNIMIENWPEQHHVNGVGKNKQTGLRYKALVRILKALSIKMTTDGVREGNIPGFLIECLVWNVPNKYFQNTTYVKDIEGVLIFLYNNTKTIDECGEWGEVSELKYLFKGGQKWNLKQTNAFILSAWRYIGFGG